MSAAITQAESGDTIMLAAGNYEKVELRYFYTEIDGLTITAAPGTVTSEGICFYCNANQTYAPKNIVIENIVFVDTGVKVAHDDAGNIDGLTIKNCTFSGGANISSAQDHVISNLDVIDCVFENITAAGAAIHLRKVNGLTVMGCEFDSVSHNAIQIGSSATGDIVIAGNTISATGSRAMRLVTKTGATVAITNNTLTAADNANDATVADRGQIIKITGTVTDATVTGNTHNGNALELKSAGIWVEEA